MRAAGFILACLTMAGAARGAEWQTVPGGRRAALMIPAGGRSGFTPMAEALTGVGFTNHLADRSVAENQIRLIGSGVALGDVDGDGRCDIYLARLEGGNVLYRNLGGWKFADITATAGVSCPNQYSTGCVLADLDGDRDLDLLVNSIGAGTRCFFNDGQGRFTERNSGLLQKLCATSMALGDLDGNGTPDLYVANYRTTTIRSTGLQVLNVNGRRMLRPEDREGYEITPEGLVLEHAEPDAIYLNDGRGNFTPLAWTNGNFINADGQPLTRGDRDWGLSVMLRDMNGDGAPDIYVCNDFWSDDAIWINNGRGQFRALSRLALRTTSTFSMGVDFADINRDGLDDFVVLDMRSRDHVRRMTQRAMLGAPPALTRLDERLQTERNTLFLNRGDGTYAEVAQLAGLAASEWSWCPAFLDVDLDGYEDLLITTGHGFDSQDVDTEERLARLPKAPGEKTGDRILRFPPLAVANQAFRNRGDLTFDPAGPAWGFDSAVVSHGLALGDLDGDGDLDAVVNNLNQAASLYRNDSSTPRLAVRLKGQAPNTAGLGAKIKLTGGPVPQSQEMIGGGRYLSGDEAGRTFAAWEAGRRFTLQVTWRGGALSTLSNVLANHIYEVNEADAAPAAPPTVLPVNPPMFQDISSLLKRTHRDAPFDDFARQPLLSRRLSHPGPAVAWADVDDDGRDDLLVGGGRGGEAALFYNRGDTFAAALPVPALRTALEDHAGVLGGPGQWLLGTTHHEIAGAVAPVTVLRLPEGATQESLPAQFDSTGPLALADLDADGDLDLFVGGQAAPGRYPEPATSRLFRKEQDSHVLMQTFTNVGQVNGAVFTDLDQDGRPELVLACEWGPLRAFRNIGGKLEAWNPPVSSTSGSPSLTNLASMTGWWQGVTAADFDGDGRMDLAASNWGRNSPYEPFVREGIRIFYGDFTGSGRVDGIEAYVDRGRVVPWRDLETLSRALPWMRQKFPTFHAFATATVADILGAQMATAGELRVSWADSCILLNRGDHFEVRSLPIEAQFAPAFGICPADFDGDGNIDLFLAQNFFETEGETSRYDAGRGLWLMGDGRGGFKTLPAMDSVALHGAQRGAAAADFNHDGRMDLAVGQNNAPTILLRNESAKPGRRVRLVGGSGNRSAVGAVMRPKSGAALGPAQEIHAGSGYWSQDGATRIIPQDATEVWIRWPGGKETLTALPAGGKDLSIDTGGKLVADPTR